MFTSKLAYLVKIRTEKKDMTPGVILRPLDEFKISLT